MGLPFGDLSTLVSRLKGVKDGPDFGLLPHFTDSNFGILEFWVFSDLYDFWDFSNFGIVEFRDSRILGFFGSSKKWLQAAIPRPMIAAPAIIFVVFLWVSI